MAPNTTSNKESPLSSPGQIVPTGFSSPTVKMDQPLQIVVSNGPRTFASSQHSQIPAQIVTNGNPVVQQPVVFTSSIPPTNNYASVIIGNVPSQPVILPTTQSNQIITSVPSMVQPPETQYVMVHPTPQQLQYPPPNYSSPVVNTQSRDPPRDPGQGNGVFAPMLPVVATSPQQHNIAPLSISTK